MVGISEEAAAEMRALAKSESLREDMAMVAANRRNRFIVNGEVDADLVFEARNQYYDAMVNRSSAVSLSTK